MEVTAEDIITFAFTSIGLTAIFLILKFIPRGSNKQARGGCSTITVEVAVNHIIYILFAASIILFCPEFIHDVIFTQIGVVVVGFVIPICETIKAITSISESDDEVWLHYWIISGIFAYCTEWMDIVAEHYPSIAEAWYQIEFFTSLWLFLPFTDGASFIFTKITDLFLAPIAKTIKKYVEHKLSIFFFIVNSGYLWIIWFTFLTLDEEARRFIVITVGTLYPIAASTIASTTRTFSNENWTGGGGEETFWLTYWVCFSILFLIMDYLEHFLGSIRGFYSICLCFTIYLFLPMFNGAEVVFRRIIVPISGQYEQMLLKDIHSIKLQMEKNIPPKYREATFEKAAALFAKTKGD